MNIAQYAEKHKLSPKDLQRLFGISIPTAYRYINGEQAPRPALAVKIVELTKGQVKLADIYAVREGDQQ